ncbi:metal-sensing transcriptional repressor [Proteus vulgaris]|uniref:metal-sensing transcriptional repressor n=1 Tax=Proteus vulgaris TaxID=585 RepID=UPI0032D9E461
MPHSPAEKKAALTRVRKIKGQLLALETALENENECGQVLQQIAAIRGAINGLMVGVLESHLREGLMDAVASPEDQKNSVDDAISLIRTYLR